jgi:hypothetical protein
VGALLRTRQIDARREVVLAEGRGWRTRRVCLLQQVHVGRELVRGVSLSSVAGGYLRLAFSGRPPGVVFSQRGCWTGGLEALAELCHLSAAEVCVRSRRRPRTWRRRAFACWRWLTPSRAASRSPRLALATSRRGSVSWSRWNARPGPRHPLTSRAGAAALSCHAGVAGELGHPARASDVAEHCGDEGRVNHGCRSPKGDVRTGS